MANVKIFGEAAKEGGVKQGKVNTYCKRFALLMIVMTVGEGDD